MLFRSVRINATGAIDQTKSDQIRSDQIISDQIRSDQIKLNQIRSDQIKSDQIRLNQIRSDQMNGSCTLLMLLAVQYSTAPYTLTIYTEIVCRLITISVPKSKRHYAE